MASTRFNEKNAEYSAKQGKEIPVWKTPKYEESKKKAIEMIDGKKYGLSDRDFWVLMNETKSGKMAYTGLIISHNGCLKINDALPPEKQFKPECVFENPNGYKNSLVFTYNCAEQGIYEVGEVNANNCKNEYPYAMAFKRCFDRVVLKVSKLAFAGVYSEEESDEFKEKLENIPDNETPAEEPVKTEAVPAAEEKKASPKQIDILSKFYTGENLKKLLDMNGILTIEDMPQKKASDIIIKLYKMGEKR